MRKSILVMSTITACLCLPGLLFADVNQILDKLKEYEVAYNNKNVEEAVKLWSEDAVIMTGGNRKTVTREEYRKMLPERMRAYPTIYFIDIEFVSISEIDAMVSTRLKLPKGSSRMNIKFVKIKGTWYLQSWAY